MSACWVVQSLGTGEGVGVCADMHVCLYVFVGLCKCKHAGVSQVLSTHPISTGRGYSESDPR